MVSFVDSVKVFCQAGNGGNGATSIRREKYKPMAGPDGGSGGKGGSIIFQASNNVSSLLELKFNPHLKAENGHIGQGKDKDGSNAPDLIIKVPLGSIIKDEQGKILADLTHNNQEFLACKGGQGGLGNARLANELRKAPGFHLLGEPGEKKNFEIDLKLIADVALVGYPSAGKSTFINSSSNTKAKVADYPFTTLHPNLGVVKTNADAFTIADVPGLIEGASEGKGLGFQFLKHIERTLVIVHVLDCASPEVDRDPIKDYLTIEKELKSYYSDDQRPRIILLNKTDLPEGKVFAQESKKYFEKLGLPVFEISSLTKEGVQNVLYEIDKILTPLKEELKVQEDSDEELIVLKPKALNEYGFEINKIDENFGVSVWTVYGTKLRRWINQTDFDNPEAIGYLSDRLSKLPIEKELQKHGAQDNDEIIIGDSDYNYQFTFRPNLFLDPKGSPRGTDNRLDPNRRPTRKEKKESYQEFLRSKNRDRNLYEQDLSEVE